MPWHDLVGTRDHICFVRKQLKMVAIIREVGTVVCHFCNSTDMDKLERLLSSFTRMAYQNLQVYQDMQYLSHRGKNPRFYRDQK